MTPERTVRNFDLPVAHIDAREVQPHQAWDGRRGWSRFIINTKEKYPDAKIRPELEKRK